MSEYRRWISYIYAYENGEKKQNTGYARLELRNGRVRISVYMDAKPEPEEVTLCCYKVQGEKCAGVRLGAFRLNTGKEELKVELEADNLAGSGLFFVEMSGLLLFTRLDRIAEGYFASSWEEEPLKAAQAAEIVKFLQGGEEKKTEAALGEQPDRTEVIEETMLMRSAVEEKENVTEENIAEEADKKIEVGKTEENKAEEKIVEETMREEKDEEAEWEVGVQATEQKQVPKREEGLIRNPCCTTGRENRPFCCLEPMYPFEDGEFDRSVRMEPQDIGLLPRSMWKYAGNSFLLHGFYTYHHLLLTRKRGKDGDTCYLLIPGTYGTKEQHMAQMFGFRHFKCLKRKTLENGDFGYWYLPIPKNQSM